MPSGVSGCLLLERTRSTLPNLPNSPCHDTSPVSKNARLPQVAARAVVGRCCCRGNHRIVSCHCGHGFIRRSGQRVYDVAHTAAEGCEASQCHLSRSSLRWLRHQRMQLPGSYLFRREIFRVLQVAICHQKLTPTIAVTGLREAAGHRASTADALQRSSKSSDHLTGCSSQPVRAAIS